MIVNIRKHSCSFIHIIVILLSFFYDPILFLRDLDELVPAPILPLPAFPPSEPFPGIYRAAASQNQRSLPFRNASPVSAAFRYCFGRKKQAHSLCSPVIHHVRVEKWKTHPEKGGFSSLGTPLL